MMEWLVALKVALGLLLYNCARLRFRSRGRWRP